MTTLFFSFQEAQDSTTEKQTNLVDTQDLSCKELEDKESVLFTN